MRDSRKNKEYFNEYLEYQYARIQKKIDKLNESNNDETKRQRILMSLTNYEIDLLKAEFSNGASKEKLRILLTRAINLLKDYKNMTKEDLLILLSLAVILGIENEAVKLVEENSERICDERLLNCIGKYILTNNIVWDENILLRKEYEDLQGVFIPSKNQEKLGEYLDSWYLAHSEYAWYDEHLRDTDTYCGYWSFESAALVKMLSFEEEEMRSKIYYPVL